MPWGSLYLLFPRRPKIRTGIAGHGRSGKDRSGGGGLEEITPAPIGKFRRHFHPAPVQNLNLQILPPKSPI